MSRIISIFTYVRDIFVEKILGDRQQNKFNSCANFRFKFKTLSSLSRARDCIFSTASQQTSKRNKKKRLQIITDAHSFSINLNLNTFFQMYRCHIAAPLT